MRVIGRYALVVVPAYGLSSLTSEAGNESPWHSEKISIENASRFMKPEYYSRCRSYHGGNGESWRGRTKKMPIQARIENAEEGDFS